MVRAMSYYESDRGRVSDKKSDYYDINIVALSGRVASNPKPRTTYTTNKTVLDFKLAYRKGKTTCYVDVILIGNVDFAIKNIRQGSYVLLNGYLNERIFKSETGDSEWTETNLLVDKWSFIRELGETSPEVYDLAEGYDE
jgi:primosomal replication protein N